MSYYGGTTTVKGRDLITSLLAGETIEFTRIVAGSGEMPEGVEPIDMEALVNPVIEATSTIPVVENNVLSMVVECRNDLNGGLKTGFWLREFGIFAKTENSEEILLYYATLGDSPQPVNAYQDNRIDIRRYPVTIALEVDADIQITYNPGAFVTAEEAEQLISSLLHDALDEYGVAIIEEITIPATGWNIQPSDMQDESGDYNLYLDVNVPAAKENHYPSVALHKASLGIASAAGMCPAILSGDGFVRFWSRAAPAADMDATLKLVSGNPISTGGGGAYVLPVATKTRLGGVKIGDNISVTEDGTISATGASVSEEDMASATETGEMLDEVFPPET